MAENTLKPQTTIRDYLIKRVLGRGSFGVTYLAEKVLDHYAVAIKEYFPVQFAYRDKDGATVNVAKSSQGGNQDFQSGLDKFLEESRTLGAFQSPHIVQVVDTFEHNGTAYMVMKYEEGGTLSHYLKSHQEPLRESQIFAIFMPLLEGLRTIHAKWLLHRDIKPENIYIRKDGSPLLIDFGTARHALSAKHGGMTEYLTPGYAPPEQYDRNADHGPWTDIYAVGATMYYCVTRITPYEGRFRTGDKDPVISAIQAAPAMYNNALLEIIDWMMDPDYQKRPQSVEEVLLRMESLRDSLDSETGEIKIETAEPVKSRAEKKAEPGTVKQEIKEEDDASGKTKLRRSTSDAKQTRKIELETEKIKPEESSMDLPPKHERYSRDKKQNWTVAAAVGGLVAVALGIGIYFSLKEDPVSTPRVTVEPDEPDEKTIADAWQQTQTKNTKEAYRNFINQYPDSDLAGQAKTKLNEIQKQELDEEIAQAWTATETENTIAAYEKFIDDYPNSDFTKRAKTRLDELIKRNLDDKIAQAWITAKAKNTKQAYEEFINQYSDSEFTKLAESKLEELQLNTEKQNQIAQAWKQALATNTKQAYEDFIQQYPDHNLVKLARGKIEAIAKVTDNIDNAWREAQATNTEKAYEGFLKQYPNTGFTSEAEQRLEKLRAGRKQTEMVEAWKKTQATATELAYQEFIQQYPDSSFTKLAQSKLASLKKKDQGQMIEDWQAASQQASAYGYYQFISKYPDSPYVKLANAILPGIEKNFWREVQDRNTANAYQQFIQVYPDSALRKLAEAKLKSLQ